MTGISEHTIKAYEYGLSEPSMHAFLSLTDSLGISPTDLCRVRPDDDEAEYLRALHWSPPPPTLTRRS
jgi:hypothetical protein